jgi:N-methylhydantoinase A/oxoprolinase/acetone carboxylase beta subunit
VPTRYYDRTLLRAGNRLEGPAIVNQYDSTTVVPPGMAVRVDRYGNLVMEAVLAAREQEVLNV